MVSSSTVMIRDLLYTKLQNNYSDDKGFIVYKAAKQYAF